MKLLVVSSWFPYPPDNGSKLRAYSLLRGLSRNHEVTLLSFSETPNHGVPGELAAVCRAVHVVAGNPFKPHRPLNRHTFLSRIPRSFVQTYSPSLQSLIDDSLPSHDVAIGLQLGAALYLRKRPVLPRVFEEAEVGVLLDQFETQASPIRRLRYGATWLKYSRFVRSLVQTFERTTVVSDIERRHLARAGCDLRKVRILPNGTDLPASPGAAVRRPATLIYPGALTYSANLDAVGFFLSEIWPTIKASVPETHFIVTGSTSGVTLEDLPNRDGVTFTGHVPTVDDLIGSSAACVVPLRLGGGTRLKVLNSMALGTPVVSTPKGAEGLAVRPEADILIAETADQFAAQVLRVLRDKALSDSLSAHARDTVGRLYTWSAISEQFEGVLQEAVATFRQARESCQDGQPLEH